MSAKPEIRFGRQRAERGEREMTWEQFLAQENVETEIHIDDIGSRADIDIENNGTIQEYLERTHDVYETKIKQLLIAS